MGSSYLLRSVVSEKENRTVEVLLLSLDPRQLMFGKILAMSVVLIVQLLIWGATSFLILDRGAALLQVSQFTFPPGFFFWAVIILAQEAGNAELLPPYAAGFLPALAFLAASLWGLRRARAL